MFANNARCRRVFGFGRTSSEHKPYLLQIAETCCSIYAMAEECCNRFRGSAVEAEAAAFWDKMSRAMRNDLLHARRAMKTLNNAAPVEMAENPQALLEQLRIMETKLAGILEASRVRGAEDEGVAASLGYSLQVHLLHPVIDRLRQAAALGLPQPILPEDASGHLDPFLEGFPANFATSPFSLALLDSLKLLRAQNLRLRSQNTTDPVTGALNRNGVLEIIDSYSGLAERNGYTVAFLMVGIGRLDNLHQTHGPLFLDQTLRSLCSRVVSVIRKSDLLGRYDFSSFLVFLPHTDHRHLVRIAEGIVKAGKIVLNPGNELTARVGGAFGRIDRSKGRPAQYFIEQAVDCLMRAGNSPRSCILIE